ncbi:MAG: hypothetical protein LBM04_09845 [Opitutaceae bacterium]|nr:hypothetical protein [Opitutaceae bacterium]
MLAPDLTSITTRKNTPAPVIHVRPPFMLTTTPTAQLSTRPRLARPPETKGRII